MDLNIKFKAQERLFRIFGAVCGGSVLTSE
jgi:hypothetical protein